MSNLVEIKSWEDGIYQLETTDAVVGGANGIDNLQGKQLGNRTARIKEVLDMFGLFVKPSEEIQNGQPFITSPNLNASVGNLDVVYFDTVGGDYKPALADGTVKANVVGVAIKSANGDKVVTHGAIDTSYNFTHGAKVYLSSITAGDITDIPSEIFLGYFVSGGIIILKGSYDEVIDYRQISYDKRQTVLSCKVDTNDDEDFLNFTSTSITVDCESSVPLIVSVADGFDEYGKKDIIKNLSTNIVFGGIVSADTRNFLYLDLDDNENVTIGSTIFRPHYGNKKEFINFLPEMTSNSQDGFITTASESASTAYRATNLTASGGDWDNTVDWYGSGSGVGSWWEVTFPYAVNVAKYRWTCVGDNTLESWTRGWHIEVYTTDLEWVTIDTKINQTWTAGEIKTILCPNTYKATKFRMVFDDLAGTQRQIAEIDSIEIFIGDHDFFNIDKMEMYDYTNTKKKRIYIGEFDVDSLGDIVDVVPYRKNGRYESEWFFVSNNNVYNKEHRLGFNMNFDFTVFFSRRACYEDLRFMPVIGCSTINAATGASVEQMDTTTLNIGTMSDYIYSDVNTTLSDKKSYTNGYYKMILNRNW